MTTAYDHLFKFTIIGDSGVGKSCLMMRFADDTFNESFITTIGVDFRFRTITVDDKIVKLQIWDTAGQEKFKTITSSYYRNAHAVMIVYDVSDRKSYENIEQWLSDIEKFCPSQVCKMIIGNKCDILDSEREVDLASAQNFAENLKIPYIETSAKTANNVETAFIKMVRQLIKNKAAQTTTVNAIDLSKARQQQNGQCNCSLI
eukprot:CAMPEP_0202712260 /NCGR_PEP_ID=MMETSP1385-20130828/36152_1 /ASSEMBLY_ACC=CAM_ASM_000861 /TAXON_ID=933848 /ORGANISM="Elphidium margaritaceum" /LENGTH=202 /DNA_ID=CAMNT_0049372231 /DNA_START=144 /DNA_END=752 /DNA_ORIENTATION=+